MWVVSIQILRNYNITRRPRLQTTTIIWFPGTFFPIILRDMLIPTPLEGSTVLWVSAVLCVLEMPCFLKLIYWKTFCIDIFSVSSLLVWFDLIWFGKVLIWFHLICHGVKKWLIWFDLDWTTKWFDLIESLKNGDWFNLVATLKGWGAFICSQVHSFIFHLEKCPIPSKQIVSHRWQPLHWIPREILYQNKWL